MDVGRPGDQAAKADTGAADYCRQVEAYLCRKNDGHLIRIVGPAFDRVCQWMARGIPLAVAFRGIDRHLERYYAKEPRRRPVRIDFCEADVLDVFDEWRRAVGISLCSPAEANEEDAPPSRTRGSLPSHLERVVARLTALRAAEDRLLGDMVDPVVRELDAARASAKSLRGESRERLLDRLRALDVEFIDAARARCDTRVLEELGVAADAELALYRSRMPREAFEQSKRLCVDRLLRQEFHLPVIAFE